MSKQDVAVEAWIDVGGTFTDCFVRQADGQLRRTKTLSSGRVPISINPAGGPASTLVSPELRDDVDGFWVGALVRFYDQAGQPAGAARVVGFHGSVLQLSSRLPDSQPTATLPIRSAELDADLEAPVLAVRRLLQCPLAESLPPLRIRLGTTKGTNALLTRRGAKTLLAITAPFEDLLWIGDQTRPQLFALGIEKSPPLAERTIGIRERLTANGEVLQPLDIDHARHALQQARDEGFEAVAVCLMHSYCNPVHELQLMQLAADLGFSQISGSAQLAPLIEIVARAQTTVVDAYLGPVVRGYLARLVDQFGGERAVQLHVMTSAGGLVEWHGYSGKDSILSGPAGGVSALQGIAHATEQAELIGLDMGGTSTDVTRVAGEHSLQYESTKAGVRILTPTLPIETVASGGGSVCWFDGVSLRVGPQSAGAFPGPACYGRGGPLAVTDLNVFLGRIPAQQFPFPVDLEAVQRRLDELLAATDPSLGFASREELADGFRRIANEQMAEAVRTVTIAEGADPRTHCLLGFGGAAGQHICEIASSLGVRRVLDFADAGLLSALGMGLAHQRLDAALPVYRPQAEVDWEALERASDVELESLRSSLREQGARPDQLRSRRWLEVRYAKTDATLTLAWTDQLQSAEGLREAFEEAHHKRYGIIRRQRALEIVAVRLEMQALSTHRLPPARRQTPSAGDLPSSGNIRPVTRTEVADQPIPHVARHAWRPGERRLGPCIVLNEGSTLVIETGWVGECLSDGSLLLTLSQESPDPAANNRAEPAAAGLRTSEFDPVFRDCFAQRLSAIATQMGVVLQQTAVSVNVKQRRDFSCAVFDAQGRLLANAPHVPVHLGAMGQTVRTVLAEFPKISVGDSFITNDPYRGGSHLPDVTVVSPVFAADEHAGRGKPLFFVANRAHHADIGGVAPGSMSVLATRLGEEGVVIEPMRLTAGGEDRSEELRNRMQRSEFPPRNIDENLADVSAQLAANTRGVQLLQEYAASASWDQLCQYGDHLLNAAEERVRQFLAEAFLGPCRFADALDDGTPIVVEITSSVEGRLTFDFSGSGPTSPTNFNANPSIVTAAVMYVLRCLIADEMPLNEGVMRCVDLQLPVGILNPPADAAASLRPAVAAGNVETSQRIVDVLLGAFGAAAASQGTMNNLLFGNRQFGFYETICGGAGAISGKAGASGVHTHMTNTRLTDPEVLEARYPVRLIDFGLRRGSGGAGRWQGGEGVRRVLEFLAAVELSLLSSRRSPYAPFGLQGGQPGKSGCNTVIRSQGERLELPGCCQLSMQIGDRLEILTPGGGGYGAAES